MSNILLLGPGLNRYRFNGPPFGSDKSDVLTVIDFNPACQSFWGDAAVILIDLRKSLNLPLVYNCFDEVHAYEILNLLPGDEHAFFDFWREIWLVMKTGGKLVATVPHWESQWLHAYPAPQRTYTPGLLTYLDQDSTIVAKSDFYTLWPKPFCFKVTEAYHIRQQGSDKNNGFQFILEKTVAS